MVRKGFREKTKTVLKSVNHGVSRRFVRMDVLSGRRFVRTALDGLSGGHFARTGLDVFSQGLFVRTAVEVLSG